MIKPREVNKSNTGAEKNDESQASVNEVGDENAKSLLDFLDDLADSFSSPF